MRKRKKQKKKKPLDLISLSSEEEVLLKDLLENLKNINPSNINEKIPDPKIARALVENLTAGDPETVNVLLAIREAFDQRDVQKAIRKTIFRFRQKGISIPDSESQDDTPFLVKKTENVEPTTHVGPIDGAGNRAVYIDLPQIPKDVDIGIGVINDEQGIMEFIFGRYGKKRMREVKSIFFKQTGVMLETSLSHVATILERAYSQDESGLRESSSSYLQLRPWILENVTLLDRPVIYDFIPHKAPSEDILTGSQIDKLLTHELMETWIINPEDIKPLMEEIIKTEQSQILVSKAQKAGRINEIKESGVEKLYPDSKRLVLKNRLEEMAYIFFRLEEEEFARLSLAAAVSVREKDSLLSINPFLKALVERSLDYYFEVARDLAESGENKEATSSPIILP